MLAVAAGLFLIGGHQVTARNLTAMTDAMPEGTEAVHKAAGMGCVKLVGYCVIGVALLVGLFMLLAGAGLMAGVTR